ncbi:MAG: hypothetical protein K0R21_2148 [Anaerocolumna sp.]|nr:hypothetical protein [Anaerocolumna sp.]
MSVIEELIREESNGTISFGNYTLPTKSKVSDFQRNRKYLTLNMTGIYIR